MPAVKTVVVRMNTPVDPETGERTRMIMETTSDHVFDPETGQSIKELVADNTHGNASDTEAGLMSPEQVKNLNVLMSDVHVISEDNPGKACMWYQVVAEEEVSEVTPPNN